MSRSQKIASRKQLRVGSNLAHRLDRRTLQLFKPNQEVLAMWRKIGFSLVIAGVFLPGISEKALAQTDRGRQSRNSVSLDNGVWTWNREENGDSLRLTIRGEVEFTDDSRAVSRLSRGGSLDLEERRGGVSKRLEIRSGDSLEYVYFVNGQRQLYDDQAKAWFATILDAAITESGLNAKPRAQKILKERGAKGLLDEVPRFKSDHVKTLYLEELLRSDKLDSNAASRLIGIAAGEMKSDHYKAQILSGLPASVMREEAVRKSYLEAAGTIHSDHYRSQILSTGLDTTKLSKEMRLLALRGVSGISSDHYKTQVLLKIIDGKLDDADVRNAYVAAAATIKSDHYRAQALSAALKQGAISKEALSTTLKAASGISSDHYKAQVLTDAAGDSIDDPAIRNAYMETAATIGSDHYQAQALGALFEKSKASKETLVAMAKAATSISSDHYKAQFLLKLSEGHAADEGVRNALVDAARSIRSDHERGRVLSALFK
jgi:hypothetical protein